MKKEAIYSQGNRIDDKQKSKYKVHNNQNNEANDYNITQENVYLQNKTQRNSSILDLIKQKLSNT